MKTDLAFAVLFLVGLAVGMWLLTRRTRPVHRHSATDERMSIEDILNIVEKRDLADEYREDGFDIVITEPDWEQAAAEPHRSDFARKVFEADPLNAPVLIDTGEHAPMFLEAIELRVRAGGLSVDAAGDLETTGAFYAAACRRLIAEREAVYR